MHGDIPHFASKRSMDAVAHPEGALPIEHYENFPVASWLCPRHLRAPIAAIYHFARTADDIADEGSAGAEERIAALHAYRLELDCAITADATQSPSTWPQVFLPLAHHIRTHDLPAAQLHALLDAFEQDVRMTQDRATYPTDAEVLAYCTRSANPVGRLLLHLYGVHDAQALRNSDAICTALQLINFWQDLSIDIPRGRHYLSDAALDHGGLAREDLQKHEAAAHVAAVVKEQVTKARHLMLSGAPLVHRIPGRAGWELRLVVQGGLRILDKIAAMDYATVRARPRLLPWDFIVMLWRAVWMRPSDGTMRP